jgi:hypothetical protein
MPDAEAVLAKLAVMMAIALALFVGGCQHGQKMASGDSAIAAGTAMQADLRRFENVQDAATTADKENAAEHVRVVTKFQPIEREVIRYVQTHAAADCLDADGLRVWRAANRGEFENADGVGPGSPALPGAGPTADGNEQRSAGGPRRGDEGVSPMQAAPGGAGELDQQGARSAQSQGIGQ